ncbi:secretion protein EspI [Mycobacterium uberis]|uniref:Secretion protein EspI n=1 Tax=Mycobacterium uberis TaxID=2162698 RepID=A0A3E1HLN7_9MYCO|nr:MinD/ParA family protein [Mycobacterium uberis]RFD27199.1 secretion protein EspI [Mycobacterium uberis]
MAADYDKLFRPAEGANVMPDRAVEQPFDDAPFYPPPTTPGSSPTSNDKTALLTQTWSTQLKPEPRAADHLKPSPAAPQPPLPPMPIGGPLQPPSASPESLWAPMSVSEPPCTPEVSPMPIGEPQQCLPAEPEHQLAETEPPLAPILSNGPGPAKPAPPIPPIPITDPPQPSREVRHSSAGQHSRRARRGRRYRNETQPNNLTSITDPTTPPCPRTTELLRTPSTEAESLSAAPLQHSSPNLAEPTRPRPALAQPFTKPDGMTGRRTAPSDSTATSIIGARSGQNVRAKKSRKIVAQRGWRHWVHTVTRINLGMSPDEQYELDLRTRVRRAPRGSYQIGILGLKGGTGKTTVTVTLGSMLAQVRNDRILVVDADTGSGNLADRAGRSSEATIADLLAAKELTHYNDIRTHISVNTVNLEVLPAAEYSTAQHALSQEDWNFAATAVSKFYNIMLADCGVGLFDPVTRGVLSTASGVVIVASASIDAARQATVALDWLHHNGYHDLLNRACMVINHIMPEEPNIAGKDLVQKFEQQVQPGRVVVLPWDKHIAAGTEIRLGQLDSLYRRRVLELAAALSDDFERAVRH